MTKIESELFLSSENFSPTGSSTNSAIINMEETSSKLANGSAFNMVEKLRTTFKAGKTKSIEFRRQQLKSLVRMFEEHADQFEKALKIDLGRPKQEASAFDVEYSKNEVLRLLMHLDEWVKPEKPSKSIVNILDKITVHNDPYGVVLIMSAWNFPINLLFAPLAGAIAAGNCTVIKPSEIADATAKILAELLPKYLDNECYQVYLGGVVETAELLKQRFDYIFFTGSTMVGKIIHAAANKHLTPITLELGGKSPVYVDNSVDMEMAVRRILWGKCCNAGQICIAPDYLLCTKEVQELFITTAAKVFKEWYGNDIKASPFYCRIISDKHYDRLVNFLTDKRNIAMGGQTDSSQRFIEPTILVDVNPNDPIMQEEIFGPILPIITIKTPQEAIRFINAREKPLVLYVFTKQKKIKDLFVQNTYSGGISINETLLHFTVDSLPFGGVGYSGMGAYHGKASFDTFVHKKSMLERNFTTLSEQSTSLRYPPYSDTKTNLLNTILRPRKGISSKCVKYFVLFCFGIVFIVVIQVIYYYVTHKHLL